jgi:hypothetical protein
MNFKRSFTVAAESQNGHANDVTGATWAITGTTSGDGLAHAVTIKNNTANDHSGKTITLTGSDADGNAISETMAGPAGSATVTSTKAFKVLDTAAPSATIGADTFDIGWVAAAVSPWVKLNANQPEFAASVAVNVSGTINYDVEHAYDEDPDSSSLAIKHSGLTGKTAKDDGQYACPVTAVRVNVNSHTGGAFDFHVLQADRS